MAKFSVPNPCRANYAALKPCFIACTGIALLGLGACKSVPEKPQPPQFNQQAKFTTPYQKQKNISHWWQLVLPPDRQAEVEQVLTNNPAILLAANTVDEAYAMLQQTKADTALNLGVGPQFNVVKDSGSGIKTETRSIDLSASLTLDLFGELSAQESAMAHTAAQRVAELADARVQQVKAYLLTLIDGAESAEKKRLLKAQIETAQQLLDLTEHHFAQGLVSRVDVLQQRGQFALLQQQLPAIDLQQRELANQLAALRGELPPDQIKLPYQFPQIANRYAANRPYDLLQKQPALLAQRAALAAQDQNYTAALLARLPKLNVNLFQFIQLVAGDVNRLFMGIIGASLDVLDGGRKHAVIAQQHASLKSAGINYLQSWLDSVHEIDNLLKANVQKQKEIDLASERIRLTVQLFNASKSRYQRGITDYIPVLNAIQSLQQQQIDRVALVAELIRIRVRLHSAIGV